MRAPEREVGRLCECLLDGALAAGEEDAGRRGRVGLGEEEQVGKLVVVGDDVPHLVRVSARVRVGVGVGVGVGVRLRAGVRLRVGFGVRVRASVGFEVRVGFGVGLRADPSGDGEALAVVRDAVVVVEALAQHAWGGGGVRFG